MRCRFSFAAVWLGLFLYSLAFACSSADRIVSIGGSVTEILYELGQQDRIIAVDATSLYPRSAMDLPNVGYMRTLSAEPIIALDPDMILLLEDAGPPETIEHLENTGVSIVKIADEPTEQGVIDKIRAVAAAVDAVDAGEQLIQKVTMQLEQLHNYLSEVDHIARVLFVLSFDQGSALVAGKDTGANAMIGLAKGKNIADSFLSYKPLGAESIAKLSPDFVLTTTRAVENVGTIAQVENLPALRLTPAARNQRIIVMDDLLLLGFGPRIGQAANELARALHPKDDE